MADKEGNNFSSFELMKSRDNSDWLSLELSALSKKCKTWAGRRNMYYDILWYNFAGEILDDLDMPIMRGDSAEYRKAIIKLRRYLRTYAAACGVIVLSRDRTVRPPYGWIMQHRWKFMTSVHRVVFTDLGYRLANIVKDHIPPTHVEKGNVPVVLSVGIMPSSVGVKAITE